MKHLKYTYMRKTKSAAACKGKADFGLWNTKGF
jgi:hypothetical protein